MTALPSSVALSGRTRHDACGAGATLTVEMAAATRFELPPPVPGEQRMLVHGVTWKDYVILREALDTPGLRMTYCKGALELMSPSRNHELWKKTIARLVEAFALVRDVPLLGYGSTTFRKEAAERGAEPDECWCVGSRMRDGEFPEIVLEVVHTAPLLDELHVYDGFEVPEVWIFRDGVFSIHRRREGGGYDRVERSGRMPDLDFEVLARYALREDQDVAVREFAARARQE
jgi:Uma2 family endonuclease